MKRDNAFSPYLIQILLIISSAGISLLANLVDNVKLIGENAQLISSFAIMFNGIIAFFTSISVCYIEEAAEAKNTLLVSLAVLCYFAVESANFQDYPGMILVALVIIVLTHNLIQWDNPKRHHFQTPALLGVTSLSYAFGLLVVMGVQTFFPEFFVVGQCSVFFMVGLFVAVLYRKDIFPQKSYTPSIRRYEAAGRLMVIYILFGMFFTKPYWINEVPEFEQKKCAMILSSSYTSILCVGFGLLCRDVFEFLGGSSRELIRNVAKYSTLLVVGGGVLGVFTGVGAWLIRGEFTGKYDKLSGYLVLDCCSYMLLGAVFSFVIWFVNYLFLRVDEEGLIVDCIYHNRLRMMKGQFKPSILFHLFIYNVSLCCFIAVIEGWLVLALCLGA